MILNYSPIGKLGMICEYNSIYSYTSRLCSLERVQDYVEIEHESLPTKEGQPPVAWPKSGDLIVENLSARYSKVCKRLTVCIWEPA